MCIASSSYDTRSEINLHTNRDKTPRPTKTGAENGGGGYIMARLFKDEQTSKIYFAL